MNTRYYYILDLILKYITIAFAIFTVFVHLSKWIQVPFIFVVYGTLIIWGAGFCLFRKSIRKQSNLYSNEQEEAEKKYLRFFYEAVKSRSPFVLLVSLALLSGVITGSINAPEEDDSAYVSPIVQNINNPEMPLSFNNDWIVPWNSGEKLTSEFNSISHSYEYFIGVISYLTGVQYLYIYQMAGSIIWGAVFFIVYFYLLLRFVNEKAALFASFSIVLACLFVFREGGIGFGIYLNKIWIGKVILQVIMPPLIAALAFDFIQKPNKNNWFLVFFACVAATGFSTSSLFIVPSLLSVLALGSLLWGGKSRNYRIIFYAFALFTTALYPLVIGAVHHLSLSKNVTVGISTQLGYKGQPLFSSAYHNWLGKYSSVSSLIILISIVYLLFTYRKEYLFIMGWFLFSMLIFVNPFTEDFVAGHLTSHLTYARIFLIVPWFALLGLALGNAFERYSKYIRFTVKSLGLTTILIVLMASAIYALGRDTIKINLDVPKNNTLGTPSFGIPSRKIDTDLVKDISAISKILPSGNTLATIEYGIAIPMFTDKYPVYYPWPPDTLKFFGKISGHEDEANLRLGALAFLLGNSNLKVDFDKLCQSPIKNLVISRKYVSDILSLERTVSLNGFVLLEKTNRYLLFTRPYGAGNASMTSPIVARTTIINKGTGLLTSIGAAIAAGTNPMGITIDPAGRFVYVANNGASTVSQYSINQITGALTSIGTDIAAGTNPQCAAIDPTGRFVYVANYGASTISQYSINQTTGALTSIGAAIAAGTNPMGIAADPTGRFVYVANRIAATVSQYSINQTTGALTSIGTIATESNPFTITTDPTGRFVYVANYGAATVSQYSIDPTTGALTSIGAAIATGKGPVGIATDPTGRFAYVANMGGSTISQYSINQTTGTLTSIGAAIAAGTNPFSIATDPTGRFVYVANYGAATVSHYSINQTTGVLTSIGAAIAAGTNPYIIAADPTGRFVYVANYGASTVSQYRVSNFAVGNVSMGIPTFGGTNNTGTGSALLGANSPALTLSDPYTWIMVITSDGSTGYIPVWK